MAVNPAATVITGISELTTNTDEFGVVHDAALVLEGERVSWIGPSRSAPDADHRVDVGGRAVLPGGVDSHTHLVFAGDRTEEFAARMSGIPYSAGGIRITVEATRAADDAALAINLRRLRAEALRQGATYLETKTGYGLTVADEKRCAALAAEVVDEVTFLGAHIVPPDFTADSYLDLVCGPMLDAVSEHARWIDVFCETGAFDAAQSARVLEAGKSRGLGLRVHGNQLAPGPGVRLAIDHGAASVDHCTYLTDADVEALAASTTVATLLPACDLSTRQPLAPARRLLDAGARIALATNANPGSSYTTSMPYCVTTAVLQMGLTIPEAIHAATAGAALALSHDLTAPGAVGVLRPAATADLHILDAPSATHLAYRPGVPLTWAVWQRGTRVQP
ncbi:imidazolonepropionase [Nocardia seriolae]|uniref:imidazolonepropionase n=1 Tax=Nocardia seriolae TaxID=37332 RepID=UPI000562AFA0|nr:imidazolonepropionase [Nocardia seriolae]OJF82021.1 imidazolonepropionase [Nocardia seriolae]PSK28880.1 imidazolonepropionase [Nocardia seriolae]QOW33894.1 imidazolonepropionase [Nocardia seriolae]QUN18612.1 imidazolonepropionase [Nocardia seriolae]WNJ61097.1 imidazolonepropionase [Nocardia seriolae]